MGSLFNGYQIYGTSNSDLHTGLGYINYDRDANVNLNDIIVYYEKIAGPLSGGAYRVDGTPTHVWSWTIACREGSSFDNVEMTCTRNNNEGNGVTTATFRIGDSPVSAGLRGGTVNTVDGLYKFTGSGTIRGIANFDRSSDFADMISNSGFKVPVWDGSKIKGNTREDKIANIVKNNIPPDNQAQIEGDYGITTWTVYYYNKVAKVLWKNDYVESNNLVSISKIQISALPSGSTKYVVLDTYDYTTAFTHISFPTLCEKIGGEQYRQYLEGKYPLSALPLTTVKFQLLNENNESVMNRYATFVMNWDNLILESGVNGDIINVIRNSDGEDDDGYIDRADITTDIDISAYDATNLLTTTYSVNRNTLDTLGNVIWDNDFIQNIKLVNTNPIDNIISCSIIPFTPSVSESQDIIIGNYNTKLQGNKVADNGIFKVAEFIPKAYYNSFLDLEPYTQTYIYLPSLGLTSIDISKYYNRNVEIYYIVDYMSQECVISLRNTAGNVIDQFDCKLGVEVSLSSANLSMQRAKNVSQLLTPNLLNLGSLVNNFLSTVPTQRVGNSSGGAMMKNGLYIYMLYVRPQYQEPKNFAHTYGKPCNLTKTLSTLSGYTKCANVDLTGIPCTASERENLKKILEEGFYI